MPTIDKRKRLRPLWPLAWALCAMMTAAAAAQDGPDVAVLDGWSPDAPPHAMHAGYLTLDNRTGRTVTIVSAESPFYSSVSLHRSVTEGGQVIMEDVSSIDVEAGRRFAFDGEHAERAVYPIDGEMLLDDAPIEPDTMHVLAPGETVELSARTPARVLLLGGAPLDGERLLWWNFVASSAERIERAKADWAAQRFGQPPAGLFVHREFQELHAVKTRDRGQGGRPRLGFHQQQRPQAVARHQPGRRRPEFIVEDFQ